MTTNERALTNRMIAKAKADGWRVEWHDDLDWWAIAPDGKVYRAGVNNMETAWEVIADKMEATDGT